MTFFFGPDGAMFDLVWQKLVFDTKLILFTQYMEVHNNNCIQTEWEIYMYVENILQNLY